MYTNKNCESNKKHNIGEKRRKKKKTKTSVSGIHIVGVYAYGKDALEAKRFRSTFFFFSEHLTNKLAEFSK